MLNGPSLLSLAREAVDIACSEIATAAPGVLTAKGDRDLASEVDFAVERRLRTFLAERTPAVGFLGEEEGFVPGAGVDLTWALDPVDGTVNFVRGIPLCGVSLALVDGAQPVLGVIGLPFLGTRYWAAREQGAFRDGRPIGIGRTARLSDAVVMLGDFAVGPDAESKNQLRFEVVNRMASRALRIRMVGSAAIDLAWLADGQADASITLANNPWDMAAGVVIAREAGARVVDLDGSDYRMDSRAVLAAGPGLVDEVVTIVAGASRASARAEWARRSTAVPEPPSPPSSRPGRSPRRP